MNRVAVRHCHVVEGTVITTKTPVSRVFLGTKRRIDQTLEKGQMIPSWSMCSNAFLAALRKSGVRRLVTRGHVVVGDVIL